MFSYFITGCTKKDRHQAFWFKMELTSILLFLPLIRLSFALEQHQFVQGSNASVTFSHRLKSSNSSKTIEIFTLKSERPFYVHQRIDERALLSEQHGRFSVRPYRDGRNVTVVLLIRNIQEIDSGVYVIAIREVRNGRATESILDAYVEVVIPHGKANCTVEDTISHFWKLIHCEATIGSDSSSGLLSCFQNSQSIPMNGTMTISTETMRAVFWMRAGFSVNCCSMEASNRKGPDICTDFEFDPARISSDAPRLDAPLLTEEPIDKNSSEIDLAVLTDLLHGVNTQGPLLQQNQDVQQPSSTPDHKQPDEPGYSQKSFQIVVTCLLSLASLLLLSVMILLICCLVKLAAIVTELRRLLTLKQKGSDSTHYAGISPNGQGNLSSYHSPSEGYNA